MELVYGTRMVQNHQEGLQLSGINWICIYCYVDLLGEKRDKAKNKADILL
jgi:hypothetical protein